jgi:hypothetical protein
MLLVPWKCYLVYNRVVWNILLQAVRNGIFGKVLQETLQDVLPGDNHIDA